MDEPRGKSDIGQVYADWLSKEGTVMDEKQEQEQEQEPIEEQPQEGVPEERPEETGEQGKPATLVVVPVPDHKRMIRTPGMEFSR